MTTEPTLSEQQIWRYVLGACGAEEQKALEQHIRQDDQARALFEAIKASHQRMEQIDPAVLDEPVPDRLTQIVRAARETLDG